MKDGQQTAFLTLDPDLPHLTLSSTISVLHNALSVFVSVFQQLQNNSNVDNNHLSEKKIQYKYRFDSLTWFVHDVEVNCFSKLQAYRCFSLCLF